MKPKMVYIMGTRQTAMQTMTYLSGGKEVNAFWALFPDVRDDAYLINGDVIGYTEKAVLFSRPVGHGLKNLEFWVPRRVISIVKDTSGLYAPSPAAPYWAIK